MLDLVHCLTNLVFLDILLLSCYTNLNSSIMCCLFSGDIYLSIGDSISLLAENFHPIIILSVILLQIKSPVASAVF